MIDRWRPPSPLPPVSPSRRRSRHFDRASTASSSRCSVRSGNRPVAGLTAADFELRDNGVRQELHDDRGREDPRRSDAAARPQHERRRPLLQRLKSAVADTAALLRADDRIRLVTISQVLHEVFSLRRASRNAMPLDTLTAEGATSLYDGIAATMMRPTDAGAAAVDRRLHRRPRLDQHHRREDRQGDRAAHRRRRRHRRAGSPARGRCGRPPPVAADGSIDSLAGATTSSVGGQGRPSRRGEQAVPPCSPIWWGRPSGQVLPSLGNRLVSRVFKSMLDDFRATYVLQYVPHGVAAEGWHEVSVTVKKHPKYEIRARKGYRGRSKITRIGG